MKHRTLVHDYFSKVNEVSLYRRYPDIADRKAWEGLSDDLRAKLIRAGEEALDEPWTQLLISDFTEFKKSGNRVRFEDKYFPRRRKLNKLVMAECVENKGRFTDAILDGLYLILEETTWCLPPHTSYERDAEQENIPDVTRQIIDLFQAESGAEVAFAEYLLRPVFAKISPHISIYVNERLKERIFDPYLNQFFWWMGDGEQTMCNWTPWIVQNVLICALTRQEGYWEKNKNVLKTFLEKASVSCDYFLDEYGEDGGCNEGAQYYTHAGLCLFGCLELIDGATDRGFSDIYKEKLIRNMATFIVKMHACGDYYVNFADCSALPGRRTAREFLFGKAVGDEALSSFAAADFRDEDDKDKLVNGEINLFYHCMQAFAYDEMMQYPVSAVLPEDSWFESMGLMVARDDTFVLAAKAGNNGDSHNHNDVGSFTIYKNGRPFVIDLGVETYTQKTFSDRRYELWTMQSQFHNVPTFIDGNIISNLGDDSAADAGNPKVFMQKDGKEFGASNVKCDLSSGTLTMDIAGAYSEGNAEKALQGIKYVRTVSLNKGENIAVRDHYEGSLPLVMSIMTYEKPEALDAAMGKDTKKDGNGPVKVKVGDVGFITASGARNVNIREYSITDERLSIAWKHSVYRILIELDETAGDYEFEFC
ncbi:heparinase II/III domain-containing protein [Butyrivibrio sp. VCB2006]|uniref:heparinase II/III domain-containing protein n=1 Tax=Butyrivibrio sp. VCB2006 TaxID=1280679 RepID=UPI0004146866|nr:heparinase II/III family protein [Butyrivibrio sp. VCB2006]